MAQRTGPVEVISSGPLVSRPSPSDSTSQIRHDIEQTRERMSGTIGEIQERLSPSHLKDQVRAATIGKVENMIGETSSSIWQTIKNNPVPSALAAVGLTWLFVIRRGSLRGGSQFHGQNYPWRDHPQSGYRADGNGETFERAKEKAGEIKEKAGELAEQAQQKVGQWVDQGKQQARRVESQFGDWMETNPVAVGAVALTLGTAVGLALPKTNKEDQWLGEARDTLVDKAQNLVGEAVDKAKEVATQEKQPPAQH